MAALASCPTTRINSVLPPHQPFSAVSVEVNAHVDSGKRKRDTGDVGASVAGPSNAQPAKRKTPKPRHYASSEEMLEALERCYRNDESSVFSGSYDVLNTPEISDKNRVQIVTHDIWRYTGYKFRVKDHPPVNDGHKTRLWCSQDIQRKPRSRAKYRVSQSVSQSGEALGKPRYPCRSRLLVSSQDSGRGNGYRLVTVRMHHHLRHGPDPDSTVPSAVVRAVWGTPNSGFPSAHVPVTTSGANAVPGPSGSLPTQAYDSTAVAYASNAVSSLPGIIQGDREADDSTDEESSVNDEERASAEAPASAQQAPSLHSLLSNPLATIGQLQSTLAHSLLNDRLSSRDQLESAHVSSADESDDESQTRITQSQSPAPSASPATPPSSFAVSTSPPDPLTAQIFQNTMATHIRNIREFCDGLEYQVQFNDFRMLRELEEKGADFLALVHECLEREGRLNSREEGSTMSAQEGADPAKFVEHTTGTGPVVTSAPPSVSASSPPISSAEFVQAVQP